MTPFSNHHSSLVSRIVFVFSSSSYDSLHHQQHHIVIIVFFETAASGVAGYAAYKGGDAAVRKGKETHAQGNATRASAAIATE